MSVRETSKEVYKDIKASGTINKQSQVILNAMKRNKDYSLQELSKSTEIGINAISGRCNELKKAGLLEENTKRKCSLTNRTINPVRRID
jgi:predicted HTH transcriptional regulator